MAPGSNRREFLAAMATAPAAMRAVTDWRVPGDRPDSEDRVHLIAHRGGVVDDAHPENSPSSLEAAIARGYWMVECDVRRSKDGQALLQHDDTFERSYGVPRRVDEMTWVEIAKLRATPAGNRPMTFDELCARCSGRIRVMLDIKGRALPDDFHLALIDSLRRHHLLESTFCLVADRVHELSAGAARRAMDRKALTAAVSRGESVSRTAYLFELGNVLDEATVELCRRHDVMAVAALNTFRYEAARVDPMDGARADADRLRALGVRLFQIDSVFDRFLIA